MKNETFPHRWRGGLRQDIFASGKKKKKIRKQVSNVEVLRRKDSKRTTEKNPKNFERFDWNEERSIGRFDTYMAYWRQDGGEDGNRKIST